jgi:hypothetical protein
MTLSSFFLNMDPRKNKERLVKALKHGTGEDVKY